MLPVTRFKWTHTNCCFCLNLQNRQGIISKTQLLFRNVLYYWTMYLGFRFEQPGCDWNFKQFQECGHNPFNKQKLSMEVFINTIKAYFPTSFKATSSLKNVQPNLTQNLKRDIFSEVNCRLRDFLLRVTFAFGKTCFFGGARTIDSLLLLLSVNAHTDPDRAAEKGCY